ncbi:MAG: hypothetical protein JSV46_04000 [Candidatus Aminicenantes bacterium]|nr:MAG: hypothetical protein JSV46_04000 [Candidatus Aminicenantes bacterium]
MQKGLLRDVFSQQLSLVPQRIMTYLFSWMQQANSGIVVDNIKALGLEDIDYSGKLGSVHKQIRKKCFTFIQETGIYKRMIYSRNWKIHSWR